MGKRRSEKQEGDEEGRERGREVFVYIKTKADGDI